MVDEFLFGICFGGYRCIRLRCPRNMVLRLMVMIVLLS
jgi:hypothetical protein